MARLFASETAMKIALGAMRIHRGYGHATECDVARCFRTALLTVIGEGINEIRRDGIARGGSR